MARSSKLSAVVCAPVATARRHPRLRSRTGRKQPGRGVKCRAARENQAAMAKPQGLIMWSCHAHDMDVLFASHWERFVDDAGAVSAHNRRARSVEQTPKENTMKVSRFWHTFRLCMIQSAHARADYAPPHPPSPALHSTSSRSRASATQPLDLALRRSRIRDHVVATTPTGYSPYAQLSN